MTGRRACAQQLVEEVAHSGTGGFFNVSVAGQSVSVTVAKSAYGNKYLKTVADGEQPNNLLSLPECP